MKKWDVFICGDINIDIVIPGVENLPLPGQEEVIDGMFTYVGGGAALSALGLAKLGLSLCFQGYIGDDCYGNFITEQLQQYRMDVSRLKRHETEGTGISICFTNERDRSFLTTRGAGRYLNINSITDEDMQLTRHIHITGYGGIIRHNEYLTLLKRIHNVRDITVSFDLGWDDTREWYRGIYELMPYINILFMNETEAVHYARTKTAEEAAASFGETCPLAVIKMGKRGSIAYKDNKLYFAPSFEVKTVDSTGAGDSFNAGFIMSYLNNKDIEECCKTGNACGALSVGKMGGNTSFPNADELELFLNKHRGDIL